MYLSHVVWQHVPTQSTRYWVFARRGHHCPSHGRTARHCNASGRHVSILCRLRAEASDVHCSTVQGSRSVQCVNAVCSHAEACEICDELTADCCTRICIHIAVIVCLTLVHPDSHPVVCAWYSMMCDENQYFHRDHDPWTLRDLPLIDLSQQTAGFQCMRGVEALFLVCTLLGSTKPT